MGKLILASVQSIEREVSLLSLSLSHYRQQQQQQSSQPQGSRSSPQTQKLTDRDYNKQHLSNHYQ